MATLHHIAVDILPPVNQGRRSRIEVCFQIAFDVDEIAEADPFDCEITLYNAPTPATPAPRPAAGWLQTGLTLTELESGRVAARIGFAHASPASPGGLSARVRLRPRPAPTEGWSSPHLGTAAPGIAAADARDG